MRPATPENDRAFFGHPRGLSTLFFSEMWERFSYYGMRAILLLFMVAKPEDGGLGFSVMNAGIIYGLYTSLVYLLGVPGGWIADKFLGLRKAVLYGGILIMAGHIALALPSTTTFYLGLALVVLGTGLLKPNISTIVGQLYGPGDVRRDSGFSIYYMGINIGAFFAPILCGYLAQHDSFREFLARMGIDPNSCWHFGFGLAAIGMGAGLIQYVIGWRHLGDAGIHPSKPATPAEASRNKMILIGIVAALIAIPLALFVLNSSGAILMTKERIGNGFGVFLIVLCIVLFGSLLTMKGWTPDERRRLVVVMVLFFGASVLWGVFEQAGSTMNLFAEKNTQETIFGFQFPASWYQSANAIMVILFAPVFAWVWLRLARRNPSSPVKFGVGLLFLAAGLLVMVFAAKAAAGGVRVSPMWLMSLYLLHTWGELCISPVGLSQMTRLAPAKIGGMVMGIWFLGSAVGNYAAGRVGGLYESMPLDKLFSYQLIVPLGAAAIFFLLAGPIRRMLARKDGTEPLPEAKVVRDE